MCLGVIFEQIIRRTITRRILQFQIINLPTNPISIGESAETIQIVQSADSIIYVYSITSLQSFNQIFEKYRQDYEAKKQSLRYTWVVGAKCDLAKQKQVSDVEVYRALGVEFLR